MPTARLLPRPAEHRLKPTVFGGCLAMASLLLSPQVASAQGVLQGLGQDVRRPSPPSSAAEEEKETEKKRRRGYRYHDHCHDCDDDNDGGLAELVAVVTLGTVTSPFWGPRSMVGDDSLDPGYFARYPYRCDLDGYMATEPSVVEACYPWLADEHYSWLLRACAEYADDFDDMSRIGGQVLLDSASRWGLDAEFNRWREDLTLNRHDSLWTGDFNVVCRFAQSPRVQMRTGIGFNWLSDTEGSEFGFNFTYGGDWFPRDPWIVSAEIDWGEVGNATLFHGRATLGVQFHRFEIYTGYDYYDVGNTQIDGVVSGLRLWY